VVLGAGLFNYNYAEIWTLYQSADNSGSAQGAGLDFSYTVFPTL
jgi:hypothetical protein